MAKLIKIDRNGSKHYEGMIECDRCYGKGYYAVGILNGRPVLSPLDRGVCWKCGGAGKAFGKWIERTPEYQAKLDAKRQAKWEAEQARLEAEQAEREAQRLEQERLEEERRQAEEARIKALKAISKHVGAVGDRLTFQATYLKSAWFNVPSYRGFGTDTMYIHTFKDTDGNVFVWKTSNGLGLDYDICVEIKGTVKEHSEYQDERQTVLTRCKVTPV